MALLSKFFGRTASEGAAYAFGLATGPVLAPATELIRQDAWQRFPNKALGLGDIAGIVAEDVKLQAWGESEAARLGINADRFTSLLGEALNAPGLPELFEAWRRDLIDEAAFTHGLRKAKLEPRWDASLKALRDVLLTPSELANARQQGFVDEARQKHEAQLQGIDAERAEIQFQLSGLPPGPATMQEAVNRNLADRGTFDQAIREGHTKTKYTDLLFELRQPLLSAATYVRLYLKGWITQAQRDAGGALWGYSSQQMEQWFLSEGRPAAPTQMTTAWARGVDGPDGRPMDEAQFLKGIKESDIRPEWGPMLWGVRYNYPSLFQLRAAVQDGGISRARALQILRFERYEDADALALVNAWVGGGVSGSKALTKAELLAEYEGGFITEAEYRAALTALGYSGQPLELEVQLGSARRVRRYRDAIVAAIHDAFMLHEIDDAAAVAQLAQANVAGEASQNLLALWTVERTVTVKPLTEAQILKAFKRGTFTRDVAAGRLADMGVRAADADVLLADV